VILYLLIILIFSCLIFWYAMLLAIGSTMFYLDTMLDLGVVLLW
jgi:hypothetical protein